MSNTQQARPIALVYRANKGCRQYPFFTLEALSVWEGRKPYCNESLFAIPVGLDGKVKARVNNTMSTLTEAVRMARSEGVQA